MTVLHLISSLRRGGMERQLCNIIASNDPQQINNHVVYFNETAANYIEEYGLQDSVTLIDGEKKRWQRLVRIAKRLQPDVIISWGYKEALWGALLSFRYGYSFVNGSIRHGVFKNNISGYIRMALLHASKYVMANSLAGLKANKLNRGFVLYNGIADHFFVNSSNGEDNPVAVLISIGHLTKVKNYPTILKALSILKDKNVDFIHKIYGDGPERRDLEKQIKQLGLSGRVELMGNVPNLHQELKKADIQVHASLGEGCCNAILESMAAGLPVVVSNVGGNPEIVHPSFALLFESEDYETLAGHLERLIKDEALRQKMGKAAAEYARQEFSMEKMVCNYLDILEKISGNEAA